MIIEVLRFGTFAVMLAVKVGMAILKPIADKIDEAVRQHYAARVANSKKEEN